MLVLKTEPSPIILLFVLFFPVFAIGTYHFPLLTSGRFIVDQTGNRVKLACVNWYGAHMENYVVNGLDAQPIETIASGIREMGFNCVRLPFSNDLYFENPLVTNSSLLAANINLIGQTAMSIFDATVNALTKNQLMVILNNHIGQAGWCCSTSDGEGLWYTSKYPESMFIDMWKAFAERYRSNPYVIGADIRNELREANGVLPTWGDGKLETDWAAAAERTGNAILSLASDWLIIVEGISFSNDLSKVKISPIKLNISNRLVYSPHDYSWSQIAFSYNELESMLDTQWGFILTENQTYTAPLWIGEFGTDSSSNWWNWFLRYLKEKSLDWSYWALDGEKYYHVEETFGILNMDYKTIRHPWKLADLQASFNQTIIIS